MKKLGVALGGGGARGIAHIGVLQALEEERIPIHVLSGTSAGSIVGALYARHRNSVKVRKLFLEFMETDAFKRMGFSRLEVDSPVEPGFLDQFSKIIKGRLVFTMRTLKTGLISREKMHQFIRTALTGIEFRDLQLPFAACAVNLLSGEGHYFTEGDLVDAVQASSSIPGWVEPAEIGGEPYIDGIMYESVPVNACYQLGARKVLAVDVTRRNLDSLPISNAVEILGRSEHILKNHLTDLICATADLSIHPDTRGYEWYQYSHFEELMYEGRQAVRSNIREIRALLR